MSDTDSFDHASNTSKGPSPIIPLLLVVALGLLLRGNSSAINLNFPLVSDSENAIFTCVVFIPVVLLLAFYSTSHSIILPLVLVLVSYTVTTMLLGPLVLILIICLATTAYLPSLKCNGEELGWACFSGFLLLFAPLGGIRRVKAIRDIGVGYNGRCLHSFYQLRAPQIRKNYINTG